ncbi:MAG: replication protein RepA [Acidobacteriota bacterium]|nr:replication protein RepA [Acidobacteriota bacterium]
MGTTLQEQLDWLNEAREADADLGFRGRMLAPCSLPCTDQGILSHFVRANVTFTLAISAVGNTMFPCRDLPRLLLSWVGTEAVRTGRRVLVLRKGFRGFMVRPGIHSDGGDPRRRLRKQMKRLFSSATISIHYRGNHKSVRLAGDKAVFWRDYDRLIPSEVRLSRPFFDSTVRRSVPVGLNCLHALRRSTLGLDLYLWLTCRTFSLTDALALTRAQVYASMALSLRRLATTSPSGTIAEKCLGELKKIKLNWPEVNDATEPWRLNLHRTPAQILPGQRPDAYA